MDKKGCKKRPVFFFGSTKWTQFARSNAPVPRRGKKKKANKQRKNLASRNSKSSCEDEIQMDEDSDSVCDNGQSIPPQKMIPISNIQVVLHEGDQNCHAIEDSRDVRLEAERLFYIGMNLGVIRNEERLQTLNRMVEAEYNDGEK
jgi:hypothetical protein